MWKAENWQLLINQFAFDDAKQRLQEKMQDTGRGTENGG